MRRFRGHERGLAEIVGTLMLVLIVVVAVTAFAAFVASYQAQLQKEQAATHQRSLEDIRILSVSTVLNQSNQGANYSSLSFVAGSLDVNTMIVNELTVNEQFINYYTVTPLGGGPTLQVCPLCAPKSPLVQEFNLTSLEQVTIKVNLSTWNNHSNPHGGFLSFYNLASFGPTDFVSISLYTVLGNDFNRVFDAPTAVALTEASEIYSDSAYIPVVVFDGSESIVPANDSIVSWSWAIDSGGVTCFELSGERALMPQSEFPQGTYSVILNVIDSGGLVGSTSIPFASKVTSPAIMVCPNQGQAGAPVTVSGTGFTPDVTISFTISTGGTIAPVTPPCTTSMTTGTFSCQVTITGPSSGTPYTVTATGSDGGPDQATSSFTILPPTMTLTPAQGPTGVGVTASGSGFTPGVTISFTISAGGTIVPLTPPCTASATGTFGGSGCEFTVSGPAATYLVTGTGSDASFDQATASFTVTVPSLALTPTQGPIGTTVTASGNGFTPGTTVTFAIGAGATITPGATCIANGAGAFSGCVFSVTSGAPASYTVTASGADVATVTSDMATATFTVTT